MNEINWIIEWFKSYCDGDWEHSNGMTIETMDNPGWCVKIWLDGTELADVAFKDIKVNNGKRDWMRCSVKNYIFEGFGDPDKLLDILQVFKNWAESFDVGIPKKQDVLALFSSSFKTLKFSKRGQTWRKSTDDLTFTYNVENSKWSDKTYYVNVGILIKKLASFPHPPLGSVQMQIDTYGTVEDIFNRTVEWLNKYDTIEKLADGCKKEDFPAAICVTLLEQLSAVE